MLWCYKCKKLVANDGTFKCADCKGSYVEFENSILLEEGQLDSPVREMNIVVSPVTVYHGDFVRSGVSMGMNVMDLQGNNLLQFLRSIMQQARDGSHFQARIGPGGIPNQMGDYVLGGEDQVRALAEHLFNMDRQALGSPPADKRFVQSLRTVPFSKDNCGKESSCSICLEQLNEGEEVVLLECGHPFHKNCLDPWLQLHSECPSCRHKLPTS